MSNTSQHPELVFDPTPKPHSDPAPGVQYGHARGEHGRLDAAETAHRTAVSLSPGGADAWLQFGHVLELQGRPRGASEAYALSFRLAPSEAARKELERMGQRAEDEAGTQPMADPASQISYVEMDDLFGFLKHNNTLTGIHRVQVNVVRHLLSLARRGVDTKCVFIRAESDEGNYWELHQGTLWSLVEHCASGRIEPDRVKELLRQLEDRKGPIRFFPGQAYVILSSLWTYRGMDRYAKLKAAGVRVGILLYDLIPMTHLEFCDPRLSSAFTLSLSDGLAFFDFVLTISEFVAKEVRRFVAGHDLRPVPVEALPLAHVVRDADVAAGGEVEAVADWTRRLAPLRRRPFVLCVGTNEPRKNHAYLLACWKLLLEERVDVPDLVFVGKHEARGDYVVEQLRASRYMDGRVHVLHDLSDAELETLYRHALFTTFPSLVEGWGNPPGESLVYGTPCVAAGNTSIPEVGGDLLDYIDPYNVRDGVAAFRRMILDREYRERRCAAIRASFRPRTWADVGDDLLRRVGRLRSAPAIPARIPLLRPGRVFKVGDLHEDHPAPPDYPSYPLRLALAEGWFPIEEAGGRMRGRNARLRFATPYEGGTELVLHLRLMDMPRVDGLSLRVTSAEEALDSRASREFPPPALSTSATVPVGGDGRVARLLAQVGKLGVVEVALLVTGGGDDFPRVGIAALGYAPRLDTAMRADLLDAFAA